MVVAPAHQPRASLGLLVVEHGKDAEDDGDAEVQANAHEALRHGVGDVLKVHRLALDQHADGDDGVKGSRGRRVGPREVRSVVEEPRRSPAVEAPPEEDCWIWEAVYMLDWIALWVRGRSWWALKKMSGRRERETYRWTAMGSSQDPGTDCTTMFESLTPHLVSCAFVPSSNGAMMVSFQRACTMPMRRALPSCSSGLGPLREWEAIVDGIFYMDLVFLYWGRSLALLCRSEVLSTSRALSGGWGDGGVTI